MLVTIPSITNHEGYCGNLRTYEISDNCPKCGRPRGKVSSAISYDGSRRLHCDGWSNPCGHIDRYADVRIEGKIVEFKPPIEDAPPIENIEVVGEITLPDW